MSDEVDTTTRWVCPKCGLLVETDYAQQPVAILQHRRVCSANKPCSACWFHKQFTCDGVPGGTCQSWKGEKDG